MKVCTSLQSLQTQLDAVMTEPETSFGLTFCPQDIDEATLQTIQESGRICDRMVVSSAHKRTNAEEKLLQSLGVDILYTPNTDSWLCQADVGVKGQPGTFLLHSLTSIMPHLVVVSRQQFQLLRALKNLQQTFGAFFNLRELP